MTTSILQPHHFKLSSSSPSSSSSSSTTTTTTASHHKSTTPGIKLAPLIRQASVVSYEKRQGKMWFIIHVDPQQFNHLPSHPQRHPYTIARRYDDCVQFCQRLYDAFPCLSNNHCNERAGSRTMQPSYYSYDLPKLKPQGLLNKKQPNGQRRAELDRFVQALFRLPAAITQTLIVLEFFGLQKGDTEQQVLSSFCSQAAHRLPCDRRRSSTRTSQSSNPSQPLGTSSSVRTMKLKVIYDVDNIVVIQIPRSMSLAALRTRLHDKFSTMLDSSMKPLADQFVLLYNENTRTSSSSELSLDQQSSSLSSSPSVTLISQERHWAKAMENWDTLEKVTLRCIH
ncbi:uncharacterized protein BX664DRAFT_288823 [Halteromyces radiatus]|uniref:uncharacterized protein n=1 Tax=Halteromyces radiatus TaxID=101107 RepID=UPI002220F5F6|nr:uncharacterized protein BX664DRAFT_288823 [Halteromyces radiatus]KAI8098982.1 hypothetical protein BX664DRAFT_288823 [Halteromyces radiatus]